MDNFFYFDAQAENCWVIVSNVKRQLRIILKLH